MARQEQAGVSEPDSRVFDRFQTTTWHHSASPHSRVVYPREPDKLEWLVHLIFVDMVSEGSTRSPVCKAGIFKVVSVGWKPLNSFVLVGARQVLERV